MEISLASTERVYSLLQDDYSRWLYNKRVLWSLTRDDSHIFDIVKRLIDAQSIDALIKKACSVKDKLVIRGAGNDYWIIKRLYPELDFVCFVDYDPTKQGQTIDGKRVITPDEFYANYSDYYVIVNSTAANGEIVEELRNRGILEERIINLGKCYESICDTQYFEDEIMPHAEREIFIDGGCYDGRTIRQFIKWCNGNYDKVYAFEPDTNNYRRIMEGLENNNIDKVSILNKGLWSDSRELAFSDDGNQGSKIVDGGKTIIHTISLDEVVEGNRVSFIKLDVEGAEYEAIRGAKDAIVNYRPKLAISIYHKPEDIFELPELILSLRDDYRFFLRHYQLSKNETILYAV